MKILFALVSYLVGSFPTGFVVFRVIEKKDVRGFGSGAIGATNILRLKGWTYALPVALIDILKGFLPAFLALKIFGDHRLAAISAGLAVLGHCFPIYIGFKGGKGVATAAGAMFALAFMPSLCSLGVFVFATALTRYVSLASILGVVFFPLFIFLIQGPTELILLSLPILLIILIRHRTNIRRLLQGEERKFGQRARIDS
jgi:glycerol-3-phosphate acyltransferase PlsY